MPVHLPSPVLTSTMTLLVLPTSTSTGTGGRHVTVVSRFHPLFITVITVEGTVPFTELQLQLLHYYLLQPLHYFHFYHYQYCLLLHNQIREHFPRILQDF
jgi:hypothetical protein